MGASRNPSKTLVPPIKFGHREIEDQPPCLSLGTGSTRSTEGDACSPPVSARRLSNGELVKLPPASSATCGTGLDSSRSPVVLSARDSLASSMRPSVRADVDRRTSPPLDKVCDASLADIDFVNEAESVPQPWLDGALTVPRTVPRARLAPRKLTGKVHEHDNAGINRNVNGGNYTPMIASPICPSSPVLRQRTPRSTLVAASAPSLPVAPPRQRRVTTLGFGMAAEASMITCRNGHALKALGTTADDGWSCDGHGESGGCQGGITGYFQSFGVCRYRCSFGCDYDLCQKCVEARLRSTSNVIGGNVGKCKCASTRSFTGSATPGPLFAFDAVRNVSTSCGGVSASTAASAHSL